MSFKTGGRKMNKHVPSIILAITAAALAAALYSSRQQNAQLEEEIARLSGGPEPFVVSEPAQEEGPTAESPVAAVPAAETVAAQAESAAEPDRQETSGRRMMKSIAQMMENPTMNKVMEASQRGAIGALYTDLIDYLDLNAEETKYFMDLLMYRQMKQVELGMKMMSGEAGDEETQKMAADIKEASDTVKKEMKAFLNDDEDYAEFEFYEKTMGERMMLAQMDQSLAGADAALSDQTYRELLGMMQDKRNDFEFTSDLNDQENMDMSPERFSRENLQNYADDMDRLNEIIIEQARGMLTPEQIEAFIAAINTTSEMQKAQLEMAASMFGGGE
jgi:hypothetical protein